MLAWLYIKAIPMQWAQKSIVTSYGGVNSSRWCITLSFIVILMRCISQSSKYPISIDNPDVQKRLYILKGRGPSRDLAALALFDVTPEKITGEAVNNLELHVELNILMTQASSRARCGQRCPNRNKLPAFDISKGSANRCYSGYQQQSIIPPINNVTFTPLNKAGYSHTSTRHTNRVFCMEFILYRMCRV